MSRAVDVSGRGVRVEGRGVGVGTAIPDSVVDDFDSQSYSGWTGDTANWGFTQATSVSGYAATFNGDGANVLYSSTLPNLPTRGDKIQYFTRLSTTDDRAEFYFFLETASDDSEDGYSVFVDRRADKFDIMRMDAGATTILDSVNQIPQTGVWYRILIDDTGQSLTVDIYDYSSKSLVASLDGGQDMTYTGSVIGIKAVENNFGAGTQFFDEITSTA